MQEMPYFMENEEWYFFADGKFQLTEKAPEKARESIEAFYKQEKTMLYGNEVTNDASED